MYWDMTWTMRMAVALLAACSTPNAHRLFAHACSEKDRSDCICRTLSQQLYTNSRHHMALHCDQLVHTSACLNTVMEWKSSRPSLRHQSSIFVNSCVSRRQDQETASTHWGSLHSSTVLVAHKYCEYSSVTMEARKLDHKKNVPPCPSIHTGS